MQTTYWSRMNVCRYKMRGLVLAIEHSVTCCQFLSCTDNFAANQARPQAKELWAMFLEIDVLCSLVGKAYRLWAE